MHSREPPVLLNHQKPLEIPCVFSAIPICHLLVMMDDGHRAAQVSQGQVKFKALAHQNHRAARGTTHAPGPPLALGSQLG